MRRETRLNTEDKLATRVVHFLSKTGAFVVAVMLCSFMLASPLSAHASVPTVVQTNNGTVDTGSSTVAFTSPVTSGDVLVVAIDVFSSAANTVTSVTDTLGSSYLEPSDSPSLLAASDGGAFIFYAQAASSGADTVTVHYSGFQNGYAFIYEVSGVSISSAASGAGASTGGSTASAATSPVAFASQGFLIETIQTLHPDTFTPGAGFTAAPHPGGDPFGLTEYSTSGVGSPTTFPMTLGSSDQWDAVGLAFAATGSTNGPPLPAVIPRHLTFNFKNSSSVVGNEVSLWGYGVMYNVPGFNPKADFYPYAVDICLNSNNSTISISGFYQYSSGNNATEFFVYNWSSINTPSAGWPSEPACQA